MFASRRSIKRELEKVREKEEKKKTMQSDVALLKSVDNAFGTSRLEWSWQEVSFMLSIAVQLTGLILSIIALTTPNLASLLFITIVLELTVQAIEFMWYLTVGIIYYLQATNIGLWTRYIDWSFSTPIGILSLYILTIYAACDSYTWSDIFNDTSHVVGVTIAIIFNQTMLVVGAAYENGWTWFTKYLDAPFKNPGTGLWLGFVPFLISWAPLIVNAAVQGSLAGWLLVGLSFSIWLLYGAVALVWTGPKNIATANTAYNLLDIVSKNMVAIVTSAVALQSPNTSPTTNTVDGRCFSL